MRPATVVEEKSTTPTQTITGTFEASAFDASELERVANYLNQHFAGRPLQDIRATLLHELRAARDEMETLLAQVQSDRLDQAKLARLFEQHQALQRQTMDKVLPKVAEWHASLTPEQKAEAVEHIRRWMEQHSGG